MATLERSDAYLKRLDDLGLRMVPTVRLYGRKSLRYEVLVKHESDGNRVLFRFSGGITMGDIRWRWRVQYQRWAAKVLKWNKAIR